MAYYSEHHRRVSEELLTSPTSKWYSDQGVSEEFLTDLMGYYDVKEISQGTYEINVSGQDITVTLRLYFQHDMWESCICMDVTLRKDGVTKNRGTHKLFKCGHVIYLLELYIKCKLCI